MATKEKARKDSTTPVHTADDVASANGTAAKRIYFAWVNRDWSARTKATGLTGAAGSALLGAWLGLQATGGPLSLVTAIIGAAAAANLILLVLDIAWDWKERDRFAATEALMTQPSAG